MRAVNNLAVTSRLLTTNRAQVKRHVCDMRETVVLVWYGLTSHCTRFHFGDGGVTAASASIGAVVSTEAGSTAQPTVCAVLSSVAQSLLITVACMCDLKSLVSVYFRCPARAVRFSGTRL